MTLSNQSTQNLSEHVGKGRSRTKVLGYLNVWERRFAYRRLVTELEQLPEHVQADVGLSGGAMASLRSRS